METIAPELKAVLKRLKLGRMLDTLPERLALARQQKTPHQDFLLLVLSGEADRRESQAGELRAQKAHLDPEMRVERWDETARCQVAPECPPRFALENPPLPV